MKINFNNIIGKIKPMHAVGQPPFLSSDYSYCHYLKEANIPYARLHDVGGIYGGSRYVDIHNIFPNFDADETNPASYDFFYTDLLLESMFENDCSPIFRLGETIENDQAKGYPARYINPPKDFKKWARVCEHIIKHYNEGWADGYHYRIVYWEIWNEPDNGYQGDDGPLKDRNMMWTGTPLQYYDLYVTTAKHLKKCFGDTIKIGGYASSGLYAIFNRPDEYGVPEKYQKFYRERYELFLKFFDKFLDYIKEKDAPLEFFSWHSYSDVDRTLEMEWFVERTLKQKGFDVEIHLNEWNNAHSPEGRGTAYANAHAVAMLIAMHSTKADMLCYYDSRIGASSYGGMFNPITYKPFCLYYGFKAFGELYALGNEVECEIESENIYALAATDGKSQGVVIANMDKVQTIKTNLSGYDVYLVDETHNLEKVEFDSSCFTIEENQVVYLKK